MSVVTLLPVARAAMRSPARTPARLRLFASALFDWGREVMHGSRDVAHVTQMSRRELRDVGLLRIGEAGACRVVSDPDLP